ncbi:MAG: 4-(cytidine 5'-diphospho)-2-C-methyl-D-erythritol kinase, partial [Spirochaetaceae bacterium]|nr:4-(cytidine 5'-diphospho)-2-C-methyl-D-erythritol kinase [Spirochaetaceae bacterium]
MLYCIDSPAKLNLSLRVLPLGSRDDGYHSIESLFQRISLKDTLEISIRGERGACFVESPLLNLPEKNTITSAVAEFRRFTGISDGLHIRVMKYIPDGAGLGGGSSDAAAVLRGLNDLFNAALSESELLSLGAAVGSDVPFFLSSPCAVVTGRGEKLTPLAGRNDLFYVLVFPEVRSSTGIAYSRVDEWLSLHPDDEQWPDAAELEQMYLLNPRQWRFRNSFTQALMQDYPVIGSALNDMRRAGAL